MPTPASIRVGALRPFSLGVHSTRLPRTRCTGLVGATMLERDACGVGMAVATFSASSAASLDVIHLGWPAAMTSLAQRPLRPSSVARTRIARVAVQAWVSSRPLAALPMRVLTQLVVWHQSPRYCTTVSHMFKDCAIPPVEAFETLSSALRHRTVTTLFGGSAWWMASTAFAGWERLWYRWSPLGCTALSTDAAAAAITLMSVTPMTSAASEAVAVAPASTLHTARRSYSSTAREGSPDKSSAVAAAAAEACESPANDFTVHVRSVFSDAESEGIDVKAATDKKEESRPSDLDLPHPPSYEMIYDALVTLGLVVGDDGAELRVMPQWTAADVKRAYRQLAKQLHPDIEGGDDALMERVNASYSCIMGLSAELLDNFNMWRVAGGEVEMLHRRHLSIAQRQRPHARWASRETEQLMMVSGFTTLSCVSLYAAWRHLSGGGGTPEADLASADTPCVTARQRELPAFLHTMDSPTESLPPLPYGRRLTLSRASLMVSAALGVQYGVVSSGDGALWVPPQLARRMVNFFRVAISRYALTVALTLAACANGIALQRFLVRLLASGRGIV